MRQYVLYPLLLIVLLGQGLPLHAHKDVEVKGLGYFKDRSLMRRLAFLRDVIPGDELDVSALEDCAFLILEQMKREGYLKPAVAGSFTSGDVVTTAHWGMHYSVQLPVGFTAQHAVYNLLPGIGYYYESISVEGVDAMPKNEVDRYFMAGGALYYRESARVFTHANFERRIGRVLGALEDLGYRDAKQVSSNAELDDVTGGVQASVVIDQGKLHLVGQVSVVLLNVDGSDGETRKLDAAGALLTQDWEQDQLRDLRNEAYAAGYPDARVTADVSVGDVNAKGGLVRDITFKVNRGEKVTYTGVRFQGGEDVRRTVLEPRVEMQEGKPLNLLEVRETRRALMGLGVFNEVDVAYEPEQGAEREVVFSLEASRRKELRLLLGWGSYEQARVGANWEQRNLWGTAQRYDANVKQSMKSTEANATYAVPYVFGTDVTGYARAEHLEREEISYDYTTQGVRVGATTYLNHPGVLLTAEYGFTDEDADRDNPDLFDSKDSATVASLMMRASYDRVDSALNPTHGYQLSASYKLANQIFGGNVSFHKVELDGAYHLPLTESLVLHLGMRTGAILSTDDASSNVPFVERFFMGGEDTVRGYREGKAAPLDPNGDEIGAQAYLLTNIELEQRLYSDLSLVVFYDGLYNSQDGFYEDGTEYVYSVGLGLNYKTVVGPLRLEYGHNPDPRKHDTQGTLHLSVGFPF
ncbi:MULTISPECIES: outer membrane protein assembly factor [unclassified Lentimonas]|uniref:BamA/OMP85 family outer membrane protein n=1 Tax=unclassified Lentimonas TaxID=2630993 RepID=UPI00132BB2C1|nr:MULTISPECIES: BamA/TamA family outer membrane protein [unclassified Lentimonas]CAA6691118.1 Unannotated [Lentimonas sp. CC10]CAA6693778.1 Unannotated [Lentimonas sp. CC19]CAA7070147.1 Unannotated [Lentimonas sp. CC11]